MNAPAGGTPTVSEGARLPPASGAAPAETDDWTRGPAKHGAAAILLIASLACAMWAWTGGRLEPAAPPPAAMRIDLNTATAAQLEILPRIGPALAQRIIEDREVNGPFASVEDLTRVRGIGPRTVERLAPMVEVRAAEP